MLNLHYSIILTIFGTYFLGLKNGLLCKLFLQLIWRTRLIFWLSYLNLQNSFIRIGVINLLLLLSNFFNGYLWWIKWSNIFFYLHTLVLRLCSYLFTFACVLIFFYNFVFLGIRLDDDWFRFYMAIHLFRLLLYEWHAQVFTNILNITCLVGFYLIGASLL